MPRGTVGIAPEKMLIPAAQDIKTLHPFFTGSIPHLEHPEIRKWGESLMAERRQLWESRGRAQEEQEGLAGCSVGSSVADKQTNGH